jgi:hypothetical protein
MTNFEQPILAGFPASVPGIPFFEQQVLLLLYFQSINQLLYFFNILSGNNSSAGTKSVNA